MYPVLTKTSSRNLILQTGKAFGSQILRYSNESSNNIEVGYKFHLNSMGGHMQDTKVENSC
ncbi:hypothetical protein DOY81_004674 [Sarcophaga bullata]|nr:hypothetical protein DOY81_004674 [Sarcophaga bullata]